MGDQGERIFAQRDDLDVARRDGISHQAEVRGVADEIFVNLPGVPVFDVDITREASKPGRRQKAISYVHPSTLGMLAGERA
jgi:hypothetical protein